MEHFLPVAQNPAEIGNLFTLVGYGRDDHGQPTSGGVKRKGSNIVEEIARRIDFYSEAPAGSGNGEDVCNAQGDSGGTYVYRG